jgi:hypothetical protein
MNEQYAEGTLVAEQQAANPVGIYTTAQYDYFKLSYSAGISSFSTREIIATYIDVCGTNITATVDVSNVGPLNSSNNITIPADGNVDIYCYVTKMSLTDGLDDNRTFSIAIGGVQGKFSVVQQAGGASSNAKPINGKVILSNTIIERQALEKPANVNKVEVTNEDKQFSTNWDIAPPQTGQNKAPTSFTVKLYLASNMGYPIQSEVTANHHFTFGNLANDTGYKVGVIATNDAGSAAEVFSSKMATPTKDVLANDTIVNIQLFDMPQKNGDTIVQMECDVIKPVGYRIDTIEIQSIDQYGAIKQETDCSASNVTTGFVGKVTRKLVEQINAGDYSGIHRYRFRAVSNNVVTSPNESNVPVRDTVLKSEWEYAQIDLTQKPSISAFTYKQTAKTDWAAASTEVKIVALARGLDIEQSTSNLIAIPAASTDDVNMDLENLIYNLTNPVFDALAKTYTFTVTVPYLLLDMDGSGATKDDAGAIALVTNAAGQALKVSPTVAV